MIADVLLVLRTFVPYEYTRYPLSILDALLFLFPYLNTLIFCKHIVHNTI